MAKVISFANHKGGVGKTTLAVHFADALARENLNVLIVDLDPQANTTRLVYSFEEAPPVALERLLEGSASIIEAVIETTRIEGVHLIGSTLKLSNIERNLQGTPFGSIGLVDNKLAPARSVYDVIILDCPPSLGFLTANALAASDLVLVPVESGAKLSLIGTDDILRFIKQAQAVNPRLQFGGAILTKHDARKRMCKMMAASVKEQYATVLEAALPSSTEVLKAQAVGKTMLQLERDHNVSKEVVAMAREVMAKVGLERKAVRDE